MLTARKVSIFAFPNYYKNCYTAVDYYKAHAAKVIAPTGCYVDSGWMTANYECSALPIEATLAEE